MKRTENCPECGRLMNKQTLADGRIILKCKDEVVKGVRPHTTVVYLRVSK